MKFVPGMLLHPNVSNDTGEICVDLVKEVFGPTKGVRELATLIVTFMGTPVRPRPLLLSLLLLLLLLLGI